MRLENYISDNKKKLEICYKELGKVKNICPCRKSSFKNYDQTLNEKWHDCWNVIHEFPLNLPYRMQNFNENEKKQIYDFFNKEVSKISCFECRKHYIHYIKKHPIEICKDSVEIFNWTVELHNDVNRRNNKKIYNSDEIYTIFHEKM